MVTVDPQETDKTQISIVKIEDNKDEAAEEEKSEVALTIQEAESLKKLPL